MADKKEKKKKEKEEAVVTETEIAVSPPEDATVAGAEETSMEISGATNSHLKRILDRNFLEFASYVIKDRAIPDINDGLKPVQRRIIWSLFKIDDGRFHKVANVIGHCMQYHPHGDQSIYGALVVLASKEYYIDKQGNFGNIFTGDQASAARYIECRLTPLARETLFNNDITEFTDSYDGRNKEPVYLPVKIPSLLMLGQEGIAPGMTTRILSHNFKELLEAQISILQNEPFVIYPDFLQGGIMDVSEYNDGEGKIVLRAKIEIDGRKLIIRELPAFCTTETLIASIERAVNKNKIKIASINDYTGESVEIELTPQRGYETDKALKALYAYTDCSMPVTSNILLIKDNRPVQMRVSEILRYNTEKLVEYLKAELEIELGKLNEKFHEKTLAQIFIENRIYKRIEECESYELVLGEVRKGLNKFKHLLKREITDEDIEKLLSIPIRRISLFDMNKNRQEIDDIVQSIAETEKNLRRIKNYAIKFLKALIEKYAKLYPRRTEIVKFDKIDVKAVALNNIKVGWDKKNCFVGTAVKSDDTVTCNEYDKLLCIERNSTYKIINITEKAFIGRLLYFCKYDKDLLFNIVYRDKETDICYAKRARIPKFIADKEYVIAPEGSKLEIINTRPNYVYECIFEGKSKQKQKSVLLDFSQIPERGTKSRGIKISSKKIIDFKFVSAGDENQVSEENVNGSVESGDSSAPSGIAPSVQEENLDVVAPEPEILQEAENKEKKPLRKPQGKMEENGKSAIKEKTTSNDQLEFEIFPEEEKGLSDTKKMKEKKGDLQKPATITKRSEKKAKPNKKDSEGEDWGISQPELGF